MPDSAQIGRRSLLSFRNASPADAPAISALVQALGQGFVANADGSGADAFWASVSAEAEARYVADPRYQFWLATHDTQLAGFIAMRDRTHLFHLFVDAPFQGQGLARALWQLVLDETGHDGPFTVNASLDAIPVYRRFGFVASGDRCQSSGVVYQPMVRAVTAG